MSGRANERTGAGTPGRRADGGGQWADGGERARGQADGLADWRTGGQAD